MTTHPILFSGAMVRAILDGTKTQTRRVAKVVKGDVVVNENGGFTVYQTLPREGAEAWRGVQVGSIACPYGQPGDRLWVKETFQLHTTGAGIRVTYRAGGPDRFVEPPEEWDGIPDDNHWRPSLFMPRWASRITLEITGVRVERLQAITEADAKAEGIERIHAGCHSAWKNYLFKGDPKKGQEITDKEHRIVGYKSPIASYQSLWNSINGPGSWDANPLVWVIEFKRSEDTK